MFKKSGFTLIEVLLVVAIIAILASIVIIAINPARQLSESRNTKRKADVLVILNAVYQYDIDNAELPATIGTGETEICKTGAASCSGLIDLSALTNTERYLISIPIDPLGSTVTGGTGYKIYKTTYNRVRVTAPRAENGAVIFAER
ncbi:MAG: type II secretion system protein [Candidatus Harrisonbacteria bacterium]|nr:type II secretion system protein [Candidatus Harrisonbacteria bacterium]MBI2406179.1 type II secretion system protein [Candidatus Harrisonbacteria bacterium]MBI2604310.1 type II secretion system protein [Candidatus Harrisonbacteria bacterium]